MPSIKILIVLIVGSVISSSVLTSKESNTSRDYKVAPGEIIVKFRQANSSNQQIAYGTASAQIQSKYGMSKPVSIFPEQSLSRLKGAEELSRIYLYTVPTSTDVEVLAKNIRQDPLVEYAEPHYYFKVHAIPNDPFYSQIYPLAVVKADSAWDIHKGDSSVVIGIIDSGVDWDHPDLASVIWTNPGEIPGNGIDDDNNGYVDDVRGWDFVANVSDAAAGEDGTLEDNNPMDFDGHGTHVSGIAAGATNNGTGISSLSWGCRIMPLRAGWHSTDGNGYVSSLYASKAYVYAAQNGASVCNQSSGTSDIVIEGARFAFKNGIVITNSAGNSNSDFAASLGAEPWALSVAATNSADGKASYSSYSSSVDISAPGGDFASGNRKGFLSTIVNPSSFYGNSLYTEFQGTSMASPFVASLAALIKSKNKNWTPAQIMFQITGTADNIDALNPAYAGKLGAGRINALRALTETPPPPKPALEFVSYSISDVAGGNGNGVIDAGENIKLTVVVRNVWGDAQNVNAVLSTNHWAASVTKSNAAYGFIPGISNLDSNQHGNTTDEFSIAISANAIPEVIPFSILFTDGSGYTKQFAFELSLGSRILIVDDDDGTVNVEQFYTSALKKIGSSYDVWDHMQKGTPSLSVLQQYSAVLWSCEWAFPSLDSSDRAVISSYLTGGGRLFLSGQDIGWDLCDVEGATIPNEYGNSGGSSKAFFEQFLKAKYVADDALTGNVIGVPLDSIGNGLAFARYQPFRAAGEQYPDIIDTVGGSVFSFKYQGGASPSSGAAVLYSGNYKSCYFSFGGFESISDSTIRFAVMERIIKWLFEYDITTDKLTNTENISTPYPVKTSITSTSPVQTVDLYWDVDGSFPYNKIPMTLANGKYSASIPAQANNNVVSYFVLPKTNSGYLPYTLYSFYVGVDTVKPAVLVTDTIQNTVNVKGPYTISAAMSDDIGVDSTSAKIHYRINGGSESIVAMTKTGPAFYTGSILPALNFNPGDVITYYLSVTDISQLKNAGRFPSVGEKQFVIGTELIDNFEMVPLVKWDRGLWNYTGKQKYNGLYSFTDSPDSNYKPNSDRIAVLLNGIDLTSYSQASLTFYQRYNIHTSDTASVEVSDNGIEWTPLRKFTGVNLFWKKEVLNINQFTGSNHQSVIFRFRMKSDDVSESDGIYIDNIDIQTNQFTVNVADEPVDPPQQFSLSQNYPNPFNPVTTIRFSIPYNAHVVVRIYDIIGREITTILNADKLAGNYAVQFDGSTLSSGIYYYTLTAGSFAESKKMVLVK